MAGQVTTGAGRPDPEVLDALLAAWPVARLAVAVPEGVPWTVPIVFAPAAGCLWSPVDGKPKQASRPARLRHLEREGRATLLLDAYAPDWDRLWWVRLEVAARIVAPAPATAAAHPAARALRAKYPQYGPSATPLFRGEPTLVEMRVRAATAWAAGGPAALGAAVSAAISAGAPATDPPPAPRAPRGPRGPRPRR